MFKSWSYDIRNLFIDSDIDDNFNLIECCDLQIYYEKLKINESEKYNIRRTSKPKMRYYDMSKSDLGSED